MVCQSQEFKIDEITLLVHPRDRHKRIFAMIEAYLDESGIHDGAAICAIAGFFGGKGQLRKLEKGWKKVLADFKFPMEEFHARDQLKTERHRPMLLALAQEIAKQRKVYPVARAIVVNDFNSFSIKQRQFMTGATLHPTSRKLLSTGCPNKPYFVPFQQILRLVTDYAPVGGKAHFNFGLDSKFSSYALTMFTQIQAQLKTGQHPWSTWKSRDRLGTPLFPQASETAQLQAADLLAYLTYQHMCEWNAKGKVAEPSKLLGICLTNKRFHEDFQYQDKVSLEQHLDKSREYAGDWDGQSCIGSTTA